MTNPKTLNVSLARTGRIAAGELPGWRQEHHLAALRIFAGSVDVLLGQIEATNNPPLRDAWQQATKEVIERLPEPTSDSAAASLISDQLEFVELVPTSTDDDELVFTGFFEPVIQASPQQSTTFPVPLYARPADLVALTEDHLRGAIGDKLTYARETDDGPVPYWTRAEIEAGALNGKVEPLCFLRDRVDALLLHIQGSGLLSFGDGTRRRVTYDGKNGHPYVSIGKWLIAEGQIRADAMTMGTLLAWLREQPADVCQAVINRNPSFIFFRTMPTTVHAAQGAAGVGLVPHRSLAVDANIHPLGALMFAAPARASGLSPRLMVAHDVGSAIRGPRRGDIYFGTGDTAGDAAGRLRHGGRLFAAIPKGLEFHQAFPRLCNAGAHQ